MSTIDHGGFGTPTPDDRRPWLWVASIVSCTFCILTLAARLTSKSELLSFEDVILSVAYLLAVTHWGLFGRATYLGLGTSTQHAANAVEGAKLFFSSAATQLCVVYLAKISVLWFARRIFSGTRLRNARVFETAIAITLVSGIVSVALFTANCRFDSELGFTKDNCANLQARWTVIQVLDAITEVSIAALPTYYVSKNTVNVSSKITVISLFGARLPCIAFLAATAASYKSMSSGANSQAQAVSAAAIWSEVWLGYALCSASFPCIRTFLTAFLADSKYRMPGSTSNSYNQGSRGGTLRHDGKSRSARITSAVLPGPTTSKQAHDAISIESDGSQKMIIQRSVDFEMTVEPAISEYVPGRQPSKKFPYQGAE